LDAIHTGAYRDMVTACKKKEEWFNKEITAKKKKEAALLKRLAVFDKPKEEEK
jgi:hypothetical protein